MSLLCFVKSTEKLSPFTVPCLHNPNVASFPKMPTRYIEGAYGNDPFLELGGNLHSVVLERKELECVYKQVGNVLRKRTIDRKMLIA